MALPIYGLFMKKVYGDSSLPYRQTDRFEFPANVDLCSSEFSDSTPEDASADISMGEDVFE